MFAGTSWACGALIARLTCSNGKRPRQGGNASREALQKQRCLWMEQLTSDAAQEVQSVPTICCPSVVFTRELHQSHTCIAAMLYCLSIDI